MGIALIVALAAPSVAASPPTVAAMRDHRRVLIVAASDAGDAPLARQRIALMNWGRGARDRDLTLVVVTGDRVEGAADRSAVLRRRWHLPPGGFQVVLIGKDGREALRARHPLAAADLRRAIDAMPMRRAGKR